jgi:hypothetical protein
MRLHVAAIAYLTQIARPGFRTHCKERQPPGPGSVTLKPGEDAP